MQEVVNGRCIFGPIVNSRLSVKEIIIRPIRDVGELYICCVPQRGCIVPLLTQQL